MTRILFLFSALSIVLCAAAIGDNEVNYDVLNTILQSPVRKEYEESSSQPDVGVVEETKESNNFTSATIPIVVMPTAAPQPQESTPGLDDVSFRDSNDVNPIDDGVSKMTEIYRECSRKIDKRVETLLNWKFSKSNTEKDLIQLKEYVLLLYRCLKVQSFRYLDSVIGDEVIPVTGFVEFVRDGKSLENPMHLGAFESNLNLPRHDAQTRVNPNYVAEIVENDWSTLLLDRLSKLLESHSMKFRLDDNSIQGRGRRRDHKMFAMMVMGFMTMATILIPMGFQFLTVLGGKSLLMAKMALIMSAINGLKKIATSQVGYGFYHTGPEGHHDHGHHHNFHDKLFKIKREPEFL